MPESRGRGAGDGILYCAIVRAPVAPMHGEPRISSAMISQQLAGHRVDALAEDGEWALKLKAPATTARQSRRITRISLGCSTKTASGVSRVLPLRAFLAPDETLTSGEMVESTRRAARFPLDPGAVVSSAQAYFAGTSYLWGGVTPWGADCSGLVQTVFALHGKQLPRDASQQAQAGEDAGTDATGAALEGGDLLFFSDRDDKRVTHVGIATGDKRMVHLGLGRGGYSVERLTDRKDAYVALLRKRFLFARRVV